MQELPCRGVTEPMKYNGALYFVTLGGVKISIIVRGKYRVLHHGAHWRKSRGLGVYIPYFSWREDGMFIYLFIYLFI